MTSSKVFISSLVVLLALMAFTEGRSIRNKRSLGVEQHCRCILTESKNIIRHISKVELIPANSHCDETEIIVTLKTSGHNVCLDPEAPWVKKMLNRIVSNRR